MRARDNAFFAPIRALPRHQLGFFLVYVYALLRYKYVSVAPGVFLGCCTGPCEGRRGTGIGVLKLGDCATPAIATTAPHPDVPTWTGLVLSTGVNATGLYPGRTHFAPH
jgi:hypothetical protein